LHIGHNFVPGSFVTLRPESPLVSSATTVAVAFLLAKNRTRARATAMIAPNPIIVKLLKGIDPRFCVLAVTTFEEVLDWALDWEPTTVVEVTTTGEL
jgi:hypothetical protein